MKGILFKCLLSVVLLAYLVFAFIWTREMSAGARCTGMDVVILDSADNKFVTTAEIIREIDNFPSRCTGMLISEIDTDSIERRLNRIDKIESASCVILSDGKVVVTVVPMSPVARIFDGDYSYYINRAGKRITADARYFLDVPVISGQFDSTYKAVSLLPLVDYISSDSTWNSLVSMIRTDGRNNIYLVPMIRGHVINFGDVSDIENKFDRLRRMYEEILPLKGWDFYDTLSVKWRGQVVATRRVKKLVEPQVRYDDESENELPQDIGTMLAATPEQLSQPVQNDTIKENN
ncbi:MAG: hypothetical protein IJY31_05565 [Muribaculaceae bacterium]|nr:hypothetical protein [Muribaculaceae bacterium]